MKLVKYNPHSLRSKILAAFLFALVPILILPILAFELYFIPTTTLGINQELKNSTKVLVAGVRSNATVAIRNHLRAIAEKNFEIALYYHAQIVSGKVDVQQAGKTLREIILSQKVGTSGYIYCLDSHGMVTIHPSSGIEGQDVSSFEFVQKQMVLKNGYIEYNWKNPGEPVEREKALYMVYFEPFDWIISVSSYREEFRELLHPDDFQGVFKSFRFGQTGYSYMVGRDHRLLIHPDHKQINTVQQEGPLAELLPEMFENGSGIVRYYWKNPDDVRQREKIAVYEKVPGFDWIIVSSAYVSEVMRPVFVARVVAYGSLVLLLAAVWFTGLVFSRRLVSPIEQMISQLDANARRGERKPLTVPSGDEIGRLAQEFNSYLAVVAEQNREIVREQKRYQGLFEASPLAVFLLRGLTIVDCNSVTRSLFGGDRQSVIGMSVLDLSPPEQADGRCSEEKARELVKDTLIGSVPNFEWLHMKLDGQLFFANVRLNVFTEEEGEPLVVACVHDITEQKKAEKALRESELKYRQLINNANDAIFITQHGYIVFANDQTMVLSGFSLEELTCKTFDQFIHPDDVDMVMSRYRRRLEGEEGLPATYPFRFISSTGEERIVQISTVLIDWNGASANLNFVRDITEQKGMEVALFQAQKMEAIGTLAGGIAHDFNNILMGIQGRISLLQTGSVPLSEQDEHLSAVEDYVKSASGLTSQLLGFARGGKYNAISADLNMLVKKSAAMFGRTRKEIEVRVTTPDDLIAAEVDVAQVEQVLLNLFVNAWHAMTGKGVIEVNNSVVELEPSFCNNHSIEPGRYAMISVSDTGSGIDESLHKRIFEPFFTTREKHRGTGMGLASAYGIIRNHQGVITLESTLGAGSTFIIYLPLSEKVPVHEEVRDTDLVKGEETVLLVDDEKMIREVGAQMLSAIGYKVLVAQGGVQALDILEKEGEAVDLVILDLIMPGMDGETTFRQIRKINKNIPVILASGYSADGKISNFLMEESSSFIQKPFGIAELSKIARAVLDRDGQDQSN